MSLLEDFREDFLLRPLPDLWPILAPSKPPASTWRMVEPMANSEGVDALIPDEDRRIFTNHVYRGQYQLPCDATERDRLDIMHQLFKVARGKERRLLNAPFQASTGSAPGDRQRILDLGCGTGIWLLDIAEVYPEAECVGVDLHQMGPPALLTNVTLRANTDYETPWSLGERSWDLIHLQCALGSVSSWEQLYFKVIQSLKPDTGWFESVEIDLTPRCDDGSLQPGMLSQWYEYITQVYTVLSRPIVYNENTGAELEKAGFRDIRHERYLLPLNGWPLDRKDHTAGMWYNIALSAGENKTGGFGMEAISLAPLTRVFNWPVEHARQLCEDALQQASDPNVKVYNWLHVWSARAP
jgi:SAM-dependent methyltransferase